MMTRKIFFAVLTFILSFWMLGSVKAWGNNPPCTALEIAVLGDSMSWIGGEDSDNPIGWTYHFKKALTPGSIKIYARSGATITNTVKTQRAPEAFSNVLNDDNVVYNQAIRLRNDISAGKIKAPSLVIIFAGTNDVWFAKRRPGSGDPAINRLKDVSSNDSPSSRTTLGESLALAIKNVREAAPNVEILLVTPVEMTKSPAAKTRAISDNIETVGKKLGCGVLRADKLVDIRHDVETRQFTNTTDGVHTNSKGAALIADRVADYVKKRYCNE